MTEASAASGGDGLRVAVVGFGWMGQLHTRAFTRLAPHYPDLAVHPTVALVCDPAPERRDLAVAYGVAETTPGWEEALRRGDIDIVCVAAPNELHRQIGVAVAEAGKHLWIEKPVGRSLDDTRAVQQAVHRSGVQSAVGFNYRNAPAVEEMKRLVAAGEIGEVTHVDVRLLSDYAAHPDGAFSWRFRRAQAGTGVLGDLVCHGVDLARYVVGEPESVVADQATFIPQRPLPSGVTSHFATATGGELAVVENEDYLGALWRFRGGARGTLQSSRVAVGDQCTYGIEVHGTRGLVSWDFRRMGELVLACGDGYQDVPRTTRLVGLGHGELARFQPGAGVAMGYDDLKVVEAARLVQSVVDGKPHGATIDDAAAAMTVVSALEQSAVEARWVSL